MKSPASKTIFILLYICLFLFVFMSSSCSLLGIQISDTEEIEAIEEENRELKEKVSLLEKEIHGLEESLSAEKEGSKSLEGEVSALENTIDGLEEEIESLQKKIEDFDYEGELAMLQEEADGIRYILEDLEFLLSNVYIGTTEPEMNYSFTAFSIEYKDDNYIITAGHCVNDNISPEALFKFKANFSDEWIYPELLGYNAEFWDLDDYAVFSSSDIDHGLKVGDGPSDRNYLLGSLDKGLSVFRYIGDSSIRGESGSPVINLKGEVIGIYVVYGTVYTPIELALDLIDTSKGDKEG